MIFLLALATVSIKLLFFFYLTNRFFCVIFSESLRVPYNCRPFLSLVFLIARWWKKGFYHGMKLGILGKICCLFLPPHTCIALVHPSEMFRFAFTSTCLCCTVFHPLQKITAIVFFSGHIRICIKRTHLETSIRDDKGNRNSEVTCIPTHLIILLHLMTCIS